MGVSGLVCGVQLVIDFDIEVALVLRVRLICEVSCNTLAFFDCEDFAEVENRLLPVCIFGVRTGREPNGFVTGSEVDVEPGNEGMDEVVSLATEAERGGKGEFGGCDGIEIDCEHRAWISNQSFEFDGIHQWLGQCILLHWGEVEAIDIIPDCKR